MKTIPWSRNSDPKAAADEDYAAIVKECEKSGGQDLLADLVTEALSNDYQPNNKVTNSAYSAQLNLDFENGPQSESPDGKSNATPEHAEKEFFEKHRPTSLIQRMAEESEVASLVAYLASPLAAATNGSAVRCEGGILRAIF